MTKKELNNFFDKQWLANYLSAKDESRPWLYEIGTTMSVIHERTMYSHLMGHLYSEYTNGKYEPDRFITGNLFKLTSSDKEELVSFVKWLFKNYRKAFYGLCGCYEGKKHVQTFKTVIHEDWGSGTYLPFFADEPDYYYIYC